LATGFHIFILTMEVLNWEICKCLNLFLIVVFKSLNSPQCEKMDLKIIQSLL